MALAWPMRSRRRRQNAASQVLGRDRVDPLQSDYRPLLTKIHNLNPQAMYCGSSALAGAKLAKQSYDIMPNMIKAGGDGMHQQAVLSAAGFPGGAGLVQHHCRAAHAG